MRPKSRYPQNWVEVVLSRRQKGYLICTPLPQSYVGQYGDDRFPAGSETTAVVKMERTRRKKRGCSCSMVVKFMKEMSEFERTLLS